MQDTIGIRIATDQDRNAILAVHLNAFGEVEGQVIAKLVDQMLDDESGKPLLSLIADSHAGVIGHVLFTSANIDPDCDQFSVRILAPLAVIHSRQRQGIGSRLIRTGLQLLTDSGVDLVFVLGYPDYYSRFAFNPAGAQGLHPTYPVPPQNADAWMVADLTADAIENCEGTVHCSNALDDPQYWIE